MKVHDTAKLKEAEEELDQQCVISIRSLNDGAICRDNSDRIIRDYEGVTAEKDEQIAQLREDKGAIKKVLCDWCISQPDHDDDMDRLKKDIQSSEELDEQEKHDLLETYCDFDDGYEAKSEGV